MNEVINEKVNISWKTVLLALGLYVSGSYINKNYKEYSELKDIYAKVNSPSGIPNKSEEKIIDNIKVSILASVEKSKRSNKKYIIDSIKSLKFRVIDSLGFQGDSDEVAGVFINLATLKKSNLNHLLEVPNEDNVIIFKKSAMKYDNIVEIATHEFNHYLDKLLGSGKNGNYYSDDIKINQFIDKKILTDDKYGAKKLGFIYTSGSTYGYDLKNFKIDKHDEKLLSGLFKTFKPNLNYYTKNSEIFVRYRQLKNSFVKEGLIKDVSDPLQVRMFSKYFNGRNFNQTSYQDIEILVFLDLDKLKELDKLVF